MLSNVEGLLVGRRCRPGKTAGQMPCESPCATIAHPPLPRKCNARSVSRYGAQVSWLPEIPSPVTSRQRVGRLSPSTERGSSCVLRRDGKTSPVELHTYRLSYLPSPWAAPSTHRPWHPANGRHPGRPSSSWRLAGWGAGGPLWLDRRPSGPPGTGRSRGGSLVSWWARAREECPRRMWSLSCAWANALL
jgi:hypothetical protein